MPSISDLRTHPHEGEHYSEGYALENIERGGARLLSKTRMRIPRYYDVVSDWPTYHTPVKLELDLIPSQSLTYDHVHVNIPGLNANTSWGNNIINHDYGLGVDTSGRNVLVGSDFEWQGSFYLPTNIRNIAIHPRFLSIKSYVTFSLGYVSNSRTKPVSVITTAGALTAGIFV